jgi:hypothetical protein
MTGTECVGAVEARRPRQREKLRQPSIPRVPPSETNPERRADGVYPHEAPHSPDRFSTAPGRGHRVSYDSVRGSGASFAAFASGRTSSRSGCANAHASQGPSVIIMALAFVAFIERYNRCAI